MLPRLHNPILLLHGFLGFDELKLGPWTVARYFANLPDALRAAGNRVHVARVSPTRGIARRAAELRAFLDRELPGERVHLIGHSMGGLDCRYLISRLDMASRVLSLTSIATPHRGTAFADWGIRRMHWWFRSVCNFLGIPYQAVFDLTKSACAAFNEEVPDAPGVHYYSIAGRHEGNWRSPEWLLPHRIVLDAEGPNDGIVSVDSARWGESVDVWNGDHINLVNWSNPLARLRRLEEERTSQYAALMERLAACEC
jgi:triacylglycerol lipase